MSQVDVHYHVSDHLVDRHKYGVGSAGTSGPTRTVQHSPVVDGFMNVGLEELFSHLQNKELDAIPRAKALRILLARSMPSEAKVDLVQRGVVKVLANVLAPSSVNNHKGGLLPQGEAFAAQILRSLAVVPAGAYSVVADGGLQALVKRIADKSNANERQAARAACLSAVQLLVSSWNTREWVLGLEGEEKQLRVTEVRTDSQQDREKLAAETCSTVVSVVSDEVSNNHKNVPMMQLLVPATATLSLLTASPPGAAAALTAKAMEACIAVAQKFVDTGISTTEEELAATHSITALWNMCMDKNGKAKCTELPLVKTLGYLLSVLLAGVTTTRYRLKAAIAGAVGAASIHVPVKLHSLENLQNAMVLPASRCEFVLMHNHVTTLGRLIVLLQECNEAYAPLFELKKSNALQPGEQSTRFEELQAAIKNTVHCIRIIAEYPGTREVLLPIFVPEGRQDDSAMATSGTPLLLRRQIFYETEFHKEFRVPDV